MKQIISIIISIFMFSLVMLFTYKSYKDAKELEAVNNQYYHIKSDLEAIMKNKFSSIISSLTLGMVKDDDKTIDINKLKAKKLLLKEQNQNNIYYLFATIGIILLLYFIIDRYIYAILLSSTSLLMLIFGVITPILLIVIHKEVSFLGDIILSYESKTILSTIKHLYSSGNIPVALVILLFSVIVPFIKSILMILIALLKEFNISNSLLKIFASLGKWSMIDVFVVSLLLVYLSAGSSQNSYSQIENGLYLFLIYVVLSIISSIVINKISFK